MELTAGKFKPVFDHFDSDKSYLIAYSGGLDSQVLLHLCSACKLIDPKFEFAVVHVNHGLQRDADSWARDCADKCRSLGLPMQVLTVNAAPGKGQSPEEAARIARYDALKSLVCDNTVLLTAQHRDDQAETILLQLLRGGGLAGLSGMPALTSFGQGMLYRPLLFYPRDVLERYAKRYKLDWIEDPSNLDESFDRNFLRRQVIPMLRSRWPAMSKTIARSGKHCAEAQSVLDATIQDWLESVVHPSRNSLQISELLRSDKTIQRLLLRHWIKGRGYRNPSDVILNRIIEEVLPAAADKCPCVAWKEAEVRRYRNELFLTAPIDNFDQAQVLFWDGLQPLALSSGNGCLEAISDASSGIPVVVWNDSTIEVRFYQGGESCLLPGRSGHHRLKKLFQEYGVPPWVRKRIPLVYIDGNLAAVGDLFACEPFTKKGEHGSIRLRWFGHGLGWEKVIDKESNFPESKVI